MFKTGTGVTVASVMLRRSLSKARALAVLLMAGLLAMTLAGTVSATTLSWKAVTTPSPGNSARLSGVAATSSTNAWAVGSYNNGTSDRTLILHWNGTSWTKVASPNPGGSSSSSYTYLNGVAATSASNAWAVGYYYNGTTSQTLILHWNGTSWTKVASPNPGGSARDNHLNGVAATSATNAWAVGYYYNGTSDRTLILHWNGTSWTKVASPNPGGSANGNHLSGVAATSSTNAWAVGDYANGTSDLTLILHWNGTSWTKVASPNPGGSSSSSYNFLNGVAATSATNAWAVGSDAKASSYSASLILHWNGTSWTKVASPNGSGNTGFGGVAATSASNAWAVGEYGCCLGWTTIIVHWNGTSWTQVASPVGFELTGVAAISASDAWAVGDSLFSSAPPTFRTLATRWH